MNSDVTCRNVTRVSKILHTETYNIHLYVIANIFHSYCTAAPTIVKATEQGLWPNLFNTI